MKERFSPTWFSTPARFMYVSFCQALTTILIVCTPLQAKDPPDDPVLINPSIRFSGTEPEKVNPLGDFQQITLPMKRVGRLFLIEARIGDQTGNFVFDTGASTLVLNLTYFRKDLSVVDEPAGGATGNIGEVCQTRVARLELEELYFENILADVISLGHIENRRGVKILGLLGMKMFRNLEMVVDLNSSELHLFRIDREGNRTSATTDPLKTDLLSTIREVGGVAFIQGTIGGKNLGFCLDTGAESNVLSSTESKKVLNTVAITSRSGLTGTGSDAVEVLFGTMTDFLIRQQPMHPMQTMITDLEALAVAYNYPLSGVLGFDFFQKGIVCINLIKKELGLSLVQEAAL